jgi:uncharacterized protein YaaR (DUF327 family)
VAISKIGSDHVREGNYIPAAAHKGGEPSFSQSFHQQMNQQEKDEYQRQIQLLFDEISKSAPSLMKKRDMTAFETYRERISTLMDEILHHAYLFQPERVRDGYGRQRVFATITVVDRKMKKLGEELFAENSEQLDLLSRVDEIRGLIMDLFS